MLKVLLYFLLKEVMNEEGEKHWDAYLAKEIICYSVESDAIQCQDLPATFAF
jgi:hypothetical protein